MNQFAQGDVVILDLDILLDEAKTSPVVSEIFKHGAEKILRKGCNKVRAVVTQAFGNNYHEIRVNRPEFLVNTQIVQVSALSYPSLVWPIGDGSLNDDTDGLFSVPELIRLINQWGVDRNITKEGGVSALKQVSKLLEEAGETVSALADESEGIDATNDLRDAYGDMLVCIIQAVRLSGMTIQECLSAAYEEIKDRKGTMVNGKFVKE